jgi:C-terminal processing protease CtpA/Prc
MKRFEKIFLISNYNLIKKELTQFLANFNDPHFFIPEIGSFNRSKGRYPILLNEINSKIKIAAVFDSSSCGLFLNDNIVSINGEPIENVIYRLKESFHGSELSKRQRTISSLLNYNLFKDSILIRIERRGDIIEREIKFGNYSVPKNFIPKHCELKKFIGNICYYKINTFDIDSWIRFYNYASEIKNSKGLIFDIRGNGGGDARFVFQILSTFIDKWIIISHEYFPPLNNNKETIVLNPNNTFHFEVPIYILIDGQTLCGGEIFAYLLRKYANAKLIGSCKSGGAFATRNEMIFPDGFTLIFDSISKSVFENDYSIEGKGIEPDIYVKLDKIEDLYPYEDKVLKTALKLLNNGIIEN